MTGTPDEERPPDHVLAAARAAYRLRRPEARFTTLVADSATDPAPGLRCVPESGPRLLTFSAEGIELHLQVTAYGAVCDLAGQFIPALSFVVELRHAGEVSSHATDPSGAFIVRSLPRGPVSLVYSPADSAGPYLMTPWTILYSTNSPTSHKSPAPPHQSLILHLLKIIPNLTKRDVAPFHSSFLPRDAMT